ncbi:MAG TPA: DUF1634 domain-containing protein [Anaeromyxobacteraceae bacterium]|nr:DUF1634 domain-containing protein [Anaeromyxobacteraceae bacterium]
MRAWTDERMERFIGGLLRAGVLVSVALVFLGALVSLLRHGGERQNFELFRGEPEALRGMAGIVTGAFALRGRSLIQLGLLVLVATPVARVAFSVLAFFLEDDKIYVVVTLVVLAILLASLFGIRP